MAAEAVCKYGARVLVTGAGRGIGLEFCRQLKDAGALVYATVRKESEALSKIGVHKVITGVDVGDDAIVTTLGEKLGEGVKLDLVINNAGILTVEKLDDLDFDRIRRQFEINSLGPLRVFKALEDRINDGGKVVNISSRMGSIDDTSGSYYGYRMSKTALNMASKAMSNDLRSRNIAVAALHPGYVRTDMAPAGTITTEESVTGLLQRVVELNMENSGGFWHTNGEALPW